MTTIARTEASRTRAQTAAPANFGGALGRAVEPVKGSPSRQAPAPGSLAPGWKSGLDRSHVKGRRDSAGRTTGIPIVAGKHGSGRKFSPSAVAGRRRLTRRLQTNDDISSRGVTGRQYKAENSHLHRNAGLGGSQLWNAPATGHPENTRKLALEEAAWKGAAAGDDGHHRRAKFTAYIDPATGRTKYTRSKIYTPDDSGGWIKSIDEVIDAERGDIDKDEVRAAKRQHREALDGGTSLGKLTGPGNANGISTILDAPGWHALARSRGAAAFTDLARATHDVMTDPDVAEHYLAGLPLYRPGKRRR